MSVWDDVVGQPAVVAKFQAAAQAARELLKIYETRVPEPPSDTRESKADTKADLIDVDSLESDQIAANVRSMSHAWLVTGPPGSGRSTASIAFAASLQCDDPDEVGCGHCQACKTTLAKTHADVKVVSTERVIIKIDEVENLVGLAQQAPSNGKWRIIIIEDADRMMERTSNLLLKAIEEPPERTVWLLCTPQPQDVLNTIRSRCRLVSLTTPTIDEVAQLIVNRDGVDPEKARTAAALAQCHIGLARHLARDPEAIEQRRALIQPAIQANTIASAVYAAEFLISKAKDQAKESTDSRNEKEEADLRRSLGIDPAPARIPAQLRPQFTALKEDQKRRGTRAFRDVVDRALLDLMAYYRDVYITQVGADVSLINLDLVDNMRKLGQLSAPQDTVKRIDAIRIARKRLASNVLPELALESMMMVLRIN